jgi:tetrahydromethanopterin S-methyltransferase subunit B
MSQGKIIPLIAAAKREAVLTSHEEIRQLIDAIDAQIDELERQLDAKMDQIIKRIEKLEEGVVAPSSD